MLKRDLKNIELKKILFIGLSNIGDAVLTLPVLDYLRNKHPQAYIAAITGPRPQEIFQDRKVINEVMVYNKNCTTKEKMRFVKALWHKKFDAVVDLRNTAFPLFVHYKLRTPFTKAPKEILHMKNRHFWKLEKMFRLNNPVNSKRNFLRASNSDKELAKSLVRNIKDYVVVSPGARSHEKRWNIEGFIKTIEMVHNQLQKSIIVVGDEADRKITLDIKDKSGVQIADLAGKLNLRQLGFLISKAGCVLTNDSAVSHIASYLDRPVVTLFGPTDYRKYAPWSSKARFIHKADINSISPQEAFEACKEVMDDE